LWHVNSEDTVPGKIKLIILNWTLIVCWTHKTLSYVQYNEEKNKKGFNLNKGLFRFNYIRNQERFECFMLKLW